MIFFLMTYKEFYNKFKKKLFKDFSKFNLEEKDFERDLRFFNKVLDYFFGNRKIFLKNDEYKDFILKLVKEVYSIPDFKLLGFKKREKYGFKKIRKYLKKVVFYYNYKENNFDFLKVLFKEIKFVEKRLEKIKEKFKYEDFLINF